MKRGHGALGVLASAKLAPAKEIEKQLARMRIRGCGQKISYSIKKHALEVKIRMEKLYEEEFNVYKCKTCRRFHTGHVHNKNFRGKLNEGRKSR